MAIDWEPLLTLAVKAVLGPWAFTVAAVAGLYSSRKSLKAIFVDGPPMRPRTSTLAVLPPGLTRMDVPDEREPIPLLAGPPLWTAIDKLVGFAREVKPDVILGLHLPGRLLSCYVAEQVNISSNKCLYIATIGRGAAFQIDGNETVPKGRALVIDDISRTGGTFRSLREYFDRTNELEKTKFSPIFFACLVLGSIPDDSDEALDVAYAGYRWNTDKCNFPWTMRMTAIRHAWEYQQKGDYNQMLMEQYMKIRYSPTGALDLFYEMVNRRRRNRLWGSN